MLKSTWAKVECSTLVVFLDSKLWMKMSATLVSSPLEHIEMKETRVALSSLKRTARVHSMSNNLPAVLCFEKGRSSRPELNRLCREPFPNISLASHSSTLLVCHVRRKLCQACKSNFAHLACQHPQWLPCPHRLKWLSKSVALEAFHGVQLIFQA